MTHDARSDKDRTESHIDPYKNIQGAVFDFDEDNDAYLEEELRWKAILEAREASKKTSNRREQKRVAE